MATRGRKRFGGFLGRIGFSALMIAAMALYVMDMAGNPLTRRWKAAAGDAAAPVLEVAAAPTQFLGGLWRDFRTYQELIDENARLRNSLQEINEWRRRASTLDSENARLRALNKVALPPRISYVTAQVIADAGGPFARARLLNIGRDGGALDGAAVVDGAGLAGRIVSIGRRSARFVMLTDHSSRVPVYIDPGGQQAVLFGNGETRPVLRFYRSDTPVTPGAVVYTSGDGHVFPRGLTVGRVVEADRVGVRVDLEAKYENMAFVRVLRYRAVGAPNSAPNLISRPDPALGLDADEDAR